MLHRFPHYGCCILLSVLLSSPLWAMELRLSDTLPSVDASLAAAMSQPAPVRTLIDVRSNHSDGAHDFATLIDWAEKRHVQVLALTEHDRYSIRMGLEPVPHLIGWSVEHPSLFTTGLTQFFDDLNAAQSNTHIHLLAGTESTPGYTWTGLPFKDLTLNDAEVHLIALGAKAAENIEALSSYQLTHGHGHQALSMVFWFALVLILVMVLMRKRKRSTALLLVGAFIAFLSSWLLKPHPDAVAEFIDSAQAQAMLVIWAHPGTLSGVREGPMGVMLNTPPYNARVFADARADAFAAVYGDSDSNTEPGGLWDQAMLDYMHGVRAKPIWAVAAGDYHAQGQSGEYLGNYPMDVWASNDSLPAMLAALQKGRMTAWHMQAEQNLSVAKLFLAYQPEDALSPSYLMSGDEAVVGEQVSVGVGIADLDTGKPMMTLTGDWIVDGEVVLSPKITTDSSTHIAHLTLSEGVHVIRFRIPSQQGVRLETNPFLVRVRP